MVCMNCGSKTELGFTTDVTEVDNGIIIVRNVPCYKCIECDDVFYTGDVVKKLEEIVRKAKEMMQEISVIDYGKSA